MLPDRERARRAEALHGIQWVSRPWGPLPPGGHVWIFTTTDTSQAWTIRVTAGVGWWISWGDGVTDKYIGTGADQAITHTYAAAGTYRILFAVTSPIELVGFAANANALSGPMPSLASNPALASLNMGVNALSGHMSSLASNPALAYIYIHVNALSGPMPSLASNPALRYIYAYNNALSGDLPCLSANVVLTALRIYSNQLTGYTTSTIATTCTTFMVQSNQLPVSAVDQILTDFTTGAAGRPASGTINVSGQTPPAPPTPAVLSAAVAALPGWTIITD